MPVTLGQFRALTVGQHGDMELRVITPDGRLINVLAVTLIHDRGFVEIALTVPEEIVIAPTLSIG